ncbi:hypothetical protein BV898_19353 [Hypsibius exemplaris]|uniref:Uncharacterized protein n=1 Tax=Hypsibius exemplaris TaxID=2072580 RepID=A0A9X6RPP5_HYPEX|nr:hypothetical protein BV898_19353 [Hypsibius exemplaris]
MQTQVTVCLFATSIKGFAPGWICYEAIYPTRDEDLRLKSASSRVVEFPDSYGRVYTTLGQRQNWTYSTSDGKCISYDAHHRTQFLTVYLLVARNLIKKTYQNYCSTPALVNGPILMLKCIEYYLMADPSSIAKLDEFGLFLDVHQRFHSPEFPQPSVTDVEMHIAFRRRRAQTVAERNNGG